MQQPFNQHMNSLRQRYGIFAKAGVAASSVGIALCLRDGHLVLGYVLLLLGVVSVLVWNPIVVYVVAPVRRLVESLYPGRTRLSFSLAQVAAWTVKGGLVVLVSPSLPPGGGQVFGICMLLGGVLSASAAWVGAAPAPMTAKLKIR